MCVTGWRVVVLIKQIGMTLKSRDTWGRLMDVTGKLVIDIYFVSTGLSMIVLESLIRVHHSRSL